MSPNADTTKRGKPTVRFVRFAPPHLDHPGPDLDDWLRKNVPAGVSEAERVCLLDPDSEVRNHRYRNTLAAMGNARLNWKKAYRLISFLRTEGDAACEWRHHGFSDKYAQARKADSAFLERLPSIKTAANRLRAHPGSSDSR